MNGLGAPCRERPYGFNPGFRKPSYTESRGPTRVMKMRRVFGLTLPAGAGQDLNVPK